MTWLINVHNGGAMTGFCLTDGGEGRYTTTARAQQELLAALAGDRWDPVSPDAGDEALNRASVLLGSGRRPLTISAHLVEPAQRVPVPGQ